VTALAAWWQGLQTRERALLALGGAALVATIYFLFVVEPLAERAQRLTKTLMAESETRQWLEQQRPLLAGGAVAGTERLPDGASLLAAINESAGASGVAAQLRRVTPAAERGASLGFEAVPYGNFMRWLAALEQRYGAQVERIRMEQAQSPGTVNVELSVIF